MADDQKKPQATPEGDGSEIVVSETQDNQTPTEELGRLIGAEDHRPEPDNEDG